jgi:hypothetical protein
MHILKTLIKLVCPCIAIALLTSCFYRKPIELVVYDKPAYLSNSPFRVKPVKPFTSMRKVNYISLYIDKKWSLVRSENPGEIELPNMQKAIIKVVLIDESGNRHIPGNYGNAGGNFAAYFAIPEEIKVTSVEITSSLKLKCNKIAWYCFDPI